ncbi:dethiobiotin synthase [Thalassotalea sp. 1_MG-2023]|uniref:dethiobiotin synthase n=1 Tax=Thalassotalea sp. 1_MG-2023 TaxID=3062680 RepID=UPI0026E2A520|nr:dethiobiotin synthase [Thalassotalea sp. 1_MG-2023]MDO6428744.1 dethiobiotin synthase [Thalassotalea sp. 1_MG-2023]
MKNYFITATDTDAGKTHIGCAIVNKLVKQGKTVQVFKPISAGCELVDSKLINADAANLLAYSNCEQTIEQVNPIAFAEPIAPHIAAQNNGVAISLEEITQAHKKMCQANADVTITEGAGGWRLPLGNGKFLSEFVQQTDQQVILIVNIKLGCLNHAILTYEAIKRDGLVCVGWVANVQQEMPYLNENLNELFSYFSMPLLGVVGNEPKVESVTELLDLSTI